MPPKEAELKRPVRTVATLPAGIQALNLGSANQMHLSGVLNLRLMTEEQGQWTLHSGVRGSGFKLAGTTMSLLPTLGSSVECQGRQQCRPVPVSSERRVSCTLAPWLCFAGGVPA